ncbi:hypothetical protein FNV43_RR11985 [Rhamnella rubrinervis]|uniref:Uncharacterized protein n=1 Tax=Rhamnella rubrinervis TaxID=2594499 RepID=A0A8K0H7E0_9ROSA|nr:hypothetical protein FNV43_RR11985 [Rhamnella rubrinervis]
MLAKRGIWLRVPRVIGAWANNHLTSACFTEDVSVLPFPPPAYVSKGVCSEALIESIKKNLQKQGEKSKVERKLEKRLRKERRKERKENKRKIHGTCTDDKVKKLDDKKYFPLEKNGANREGAYPRKGIRDEAEQVEKSDVTEEHDQPTCFESSRYFSDSTQSSDKRKRALSSCNGNEIQSGGQTQRPVIRIQLSLRKHKELNAGSSRSSKEDVTKRADSSAQERTVLSHVPIENQFFRTNSEITTESEKLAPKSGQVSTSAVERMEMCSQTGTAEGISSFENKATSAGREWKYALRLEQLKGLVRVKIRSKELNHRIKH